MPWELRGGRKYFYLPARVDGQPRRIYYGSGVAGRVHELLTALDRRKRAKRTAAAKARAAAVTALRHLVGEVLRWAGQLVRAARLANGEHQHKGQWRWRKNRPDTITRTTPMGTTTTGGSGDEQAANLGELVRRMNDRANGGDATALAELEELLTRHPEVWETYAKLAADTASGWASLLGGGEAVGEACLRHEIANWKSRLVGPTPAPLVTAAVDAAAVSWMSQRYAERDLLRASEKKRAASQKQLATATRQLQDAIKLVITARAAADVTANRAEDENKVAGGPRLFDATAG